MPPSMLDPTKRGATRSRANLQMVQALRDIRTLGVRTSRAVADLRWRPIDGNTIRQQSRVWHAGHVSALLADGGVIIAGTQTGGVWIVNSFAGAFPITSTFSAECASDDWDNPDISCLAYLPGRTDACYAGCADGFNLYLVELVAQFGAMRFSKATQISLPWLGLSLLSILVLPASNRILLAGGTGVWWSPIPAAPTMGGAYVWQQAQGLTAGTFSSLAVGPDESVIAAAWGANPTTGHHGLFRGQWAADGTLQFTRATVNGVNTVTMFRTSVASCAGNPRRVYAVGAASDNAATSGISAVLRSDDGGANWAAATVPMNPGGQGEYNNCIAVSRTRPDVVVIGWRGGGPFYSADAGANWNQPHTDGGPTLDINLHSDLHAFYFASDPNGADDLVMGSDGGIVRTRDLGQTNESEPGQQVRNLQFYGGAFTVSSEFPGLVAGGTQDNGNIFCHSAPSPQHFPDPAYWMQLEGGDGSVNRFIDGLGALIYSNNTLLNGTVEFGNQTRIHFWDEEHRRFTGRTLNPAAGKYVYADFPWDPPKGDYGRFGRMINVEGQGGGASGGLVNPIIEVVSSPGWAWDGELMYAVASPMNTPQGPVYGLFPNPDGTTARWRKLADVNVQVTGLASYGGAMVLVGTADGRILSLDSASRQVTAMMMADGLAGTGAIGRIEIAPAGALAFASRSFAYHTGAGLLRLVGNTWGPIGGSGFTAFTLDPAPGSQRLFASTDSRVLVSNDDGTTWTEASQGLPERPHCSDLRIGKSRGGGRDLYLGTYGRSVWRAQIELPPPKQPSEITPRAVDIIAGIVQDGGGLIFVGGKIVPIPPRSPLRDIMLALSMETQASAMSEDSALVVRRTMFDLVAAIAQRERRQLG